MVVARGVLHQRGVRHRPLPALLLRPDPTYPADLEIDFPQRLSRGLVLVKWWLLAIPQYVVVGLLISSPWWIWENQNYQWTIGAGGLVGLLALIGIVVHASAAPTRAPCSTWSSASTGGCCASPATSPS